MRAISRAISRTDRLPEFLNSLYLIVLSLLLLFIFFAYATGYRKKCLVLIERKSYLHISLMAIESCK